MRKRLFRISGILSIIAAAMLGALLFSTSQSVREAETEMRRLTNAVQNEKEAIRVLGTEWDYLNRPERLEKLARENLDLYQPDQKKLISQSQSIPVPGIPVLPPVKPSFRPQPVAHLPSTLSAKISEPEKKSTIEEKDKKSFEALLKDLSDGGAE